MSAINERMLAEWRKLYALLRPSLNPASWTEGQPPALFIAGWYAREMQIADWSARCAGLEAELAYWRERYDALADMLEQERQSSKTGC